MKIIIKTLQGKQLPLEVEESHTVSTRSSDKIIDQTSEGLDWIRTQDASRFTKIDRLWESSVRRWENIEGLWH